jgi:hypothetical protein
MPTVVVKSVSHPQVDIKTDAIHPCDLRFKCSWQLPGLNCSRPTSCVMHENYHSAVGESQSRGDDCSVGTVSMQVTITHHAVQYIHSV